MECAPRAATTQRTIVLTFERPVPVLSQTCRLNIDHLAQNGDVSISFDIQRDRIANYAPGLEVSSRASEVLQVVDRRMRLKLQNHATMLLAAALPVLPDEPTTEYARWNNIFPFVNSLVDLLEKYKDPQLNETGVPCVGTCLRWVCTAQYNLRPIKPRGWIRSTNVLNRDCS